MNSSSKTLPELSFLHSIFMVDETSPSGLKWKAYSKGRRKDLVAGSKTTNKSTGKTYWQVYVNKSCYYVHRIIYYLITSVDPGKCVIDHINGDGTMNSFENLRAISQQNNSLNHKLYKNNSSKFNGISYAKDRNKYQAYYYINRKQHHIGFYNTLDEAVKARNIYLEDQDDIDRLMPESLQ